ncbi:MAG: hypothetical protein JO297_14715 [Nitrososphaeraceae archaeon]|nr:hypothetical protein [Nitrososphaeraceae archaeon]
MKVSSPSMEKVTQLPNVSSLNLVRGRDFKSVDALHIRNHALPSFLGVLIKPFLLLLISIFLLQFRKMVGLPEASYSEEEEKNKNEEDDRSYLHSSSNIQQHHNSKQSTISDFTT